MGRKVAGLSNTAPDVSVIVPVYNVERYIERCLSSLINQTCSCKYEIIVVNDGTKDNSMEIVRRFADKYNNITIIEQENGGLSCARNTGIAHAAGEYIAFVDSDDYVSPDYIKLLYDSATENNSDVVCCNYFNVFEKSGKSRGNFPKHPCGLYSASKTLKEIIGDVKIRSYVWNKMYRRKIFTDNSLKFPVGVNFEDFAVMPQVFYYAKTVSFIPQKLYNYVHREGSITGSICKKDINNYLLAFSFLREFMEDKGIYDEYRFTYRLLSKKIELTIFGMLLRCWAREPKTTYVLKNYGLTRKFLKFYSGKEYYCTPTSKPTIKII